MKNTKPTTLITNIYLLILFIVYPLILHNGYYDVVETKFYIFLIITFLTGMFCIIMVAMESRFDLFPLSLTDIFLPDYNNDMFSWADFR